MIGSNHVSIDCETLGVAYDAPIIAIGACLFNIDTGKVGAKFYQEIMMSSAIKYGRVDSETVAWWIAQSDRAKAIFAKPNEGKSSVATVLLEFSHWYRDHASQDSLAWAKPSTKDITWLEHAFTVGGHGLTIPWRHNQVGDLYTLLQVAERIAGFDASKIKQAGTEHNAVDDAVYQANIICAAYKALSEYNPQKRQAAALKNKPKDDDDEL